MSLLVGIAMAGEDLEKPAFTETGQDANPWFAVKPAEWDSGQGEHSQGTEYCKGCPSVAWKVNCLFSHM